MSAAPVRTQAELKQRRKNVKAIAKRRRRRQYCNQGHKSWRLRKNGKRICRVCESDRSYYYRIRRKLKCQK